MIYKLTYFIYSLINIKYDSLNGTETNKIPAFTIKPEHFVS